MEYLAAQLFALIMIWLPLCALTLLPFVAIVLPE